MQTENEQGLLRRSDALTLEEIQASTALTGKIASASALKIIDERNKDFLLISVYGDEGTFSFKINIIDVRLTVIVFSSHGYGQVIIRNGTIIQQIGNAEFSIDGDVLTVNNLFWYAMNLMIIHRALFNSYL